MKEVDAIMQSIEGLATGMLAERTRFSRLSWALAFLLAIVAFLAAYYFFLIVTDSSGTFYSATNLADFDGDGDLDVLLHNVRQEAEFTAFSVGTLWFNQGDGQFVAQRIRTALGEPGGWASAAGDVDHDGDTDLLFFMGHYLRLLVNQGGVQEGRAGEFRDSLRIAGPEGSGQYGSVILGDLNSDGQIDGLVVGCCGRLFTLDPNADSPNVSGVWINELAGGGGSGRMSPVAPLEGLAVRAAALGDLDGDGALDIFAAVMAPDTGRNNDAADRILFNDGTGRFTDSGQRLGRIDSTAVALGDLDGDGDLDALVGSASGVAVWLNQGGAQGNQEGTFALLGQAISGEQIKAIVLSDLDGDGDLDALIAGRQAATIWWNDGQAGFAQGQQRFRYTKRHGVAIGDFNGDGWPDIFAAAYDSDYRVWFNRGNGTFR
jgi:hypothetical protein